MDQPLFFGEHDGATTITAIGHSREEVITLIRKAYAQEQGGLENQYSGNLLLSEDDINVREVTLGQVWVDKYDPIDVTDTPLLTPLADKAKELGWEKVGTGGGCTALTLSLDDDFYLMITEDSIAPEAEEAQVVVGLYATDENNWPEVFTQGVMLQIDGSHDTTAGRALEIVEKVIVPNWKNLRLRCGLGNFPQIDNLPTLEINAG